MESKIVAVALAGGLALRREGKRFACLCAFHPERRASMQITPAIDAFRCWSCGARGGYLRLAERLGVDINLVCPRDSSSVPSRPLPPAPTVPQPEKRADAATIGILADLPDYTCDAAARAYAERRGLNASDRIRFVDRDTPLVSKRFAKRAHAAGFRIAALMYDLAGNVSGGQLRNLGDGDERELETIGGGTFGSRARISTAKRITICEGLTDYLVGEAAFDGPHAPVIGIAGVGAVGTLERCTFPRGVDVMIATDPDTAGDLAAGKIAAIVRRNGGHPVRVFGEVFGV